MVKIDPNARDLVSCRTTVNKHRSIGIFYGENPLQTPFSLLLLEMSLVILLSRLVRFLLKPLRQPRVVSDVIGGIIVGPTVLGRSRTFARKMFSDEGSFLVHNLGVLGFIYFLFISGVKMDLSMMKGSGRKHVMIAVCGAITPLVSVTLVALLFRTRLDHELEKGSSIWGVAASMSITAFPVLYPILREQNLLSSEIGRMALSVSIITDAIGITFVIAFEAAKQGESRSKAALWHLVSLFGFIGFTTTVVRRAMTWVIRRTPEGKPVAQVYIIFILLGVMVMAFLSDFLGAAIANGPLWLGLAIPDGPPLGSTIVDKCETIMMELFMPFAYASVGLYVDLFSLSDYWSALSPLFIMVITGFSAKLLSTLLTAHFLEMPFRDSLTLSLIMSFRGQVEYLLYLHWVDLKMVKLPGFTLMVLSSTVLTAVVTPLVSTLYNPTRPYMVNKRRTIQHTAPNAELHLVACIHDQENVAWLINLLEVSNPTLSSPVVVYALRLVELLGRASPIFIDHEKHEKQYGENTSYSTVHSALKLYQETRGDYVRIHPFTAVSPRRSMYQDICELALVNKASLIILPFHAEGIDINGNISHMVNSCILAHAPCSVAILVDKGPQRNQCVTRSFRASSRHFAVLFLGGADAREALAYADRMAGNPDVSLTVVRFLTENYERDDGLEKKLDDGLVTWFWVKNEANEQVIYKEVVVRNGEETVSAIQAMNNDAYDLWIMGRKHGINPVLLEGLSNWSENQELGVIGDYIASMDFSSTASVLVLQQQILRGQRMPASHSIC
ncbi:cation/H(+) antiporter 24-like [Vitis riparia]|uniref:cation/H(+) antiporter 24-like n=1 Tax=Vitis riparia TaxID=96939 RepID=UPI00155B12B5|nr:cation/H(+) antiporter 24-like [Vitis riparia]